MAMFQCNPINDLSSLPMLSAIGDVSGQRVWAIVLGVLLAVVAIALLVASWTKWGQTKSLTKCIALAFLAHVWLLMYAYGTRIVMPGMGGGTGGGIRNESMMLAMPLLVLNEPSTEESTATDANAPEEAPASTLESIPLQAWEAPLKRIALPDALSPSNAQAPAPPTFAPPELPKAFADAPPMAKTEAEWKEPELPSMDSADQLAMMAAAELATQPPSPPATALNGMSPLPSIAAEKQTSAPVAVAANVARSTPARKVDSQPVPTNYQMRLSPQRGQFAMLNGGDVNTEASVERALAWLARAQGADGGWNAAEHGAGREPIATNLPPDSEYRHNTGLKANTAMTGLALLAFLGAGHTHTDGRYQENVTRGLRYLLSQQLPSGDLSGRDQVGRDPTVRFARMYSHGMASLALAEAFGMTGDTVLQPPIQSACRYTMNAMNPRTGGWRYEFPTDDPGDLSQFGWQAMLLNSAANNQTIVLPPQNKLLMQRFLDSVSTGRHNGLAVYRSRPGMQATIDQATPSMTAEAMASRLLLGFPMLPQAAEEGQQLLLRNLPGRSEENLYYWYYATLALYQLRGDARWNSDPSPTGTLTRSEQVWNTWNDSLKQQLCATQVPRGKEEGSWNPTCIWGGYGGRVYSTATACMCLEVYYRYLPMYKSEEFASQWKPSRR